MAETAEQGEGGASDAPPAQQSGPNSHADLNGFANGSVNGEANLQQINSSGDIGGVSDRQTAAQSLALLADPNGAANSGMLHWNGTHTVNAEHQYCYCGKDRNLLEPDFQCVGCKNFFHRSCIEIQLPNVTSFITNYQFSCKKCSLNRVETFTRFGPVAWKAVVATAIANLTVEKIVSDNPGTDLTSKNQVALSGVSYYFGRHRDIMPFLERPNMWSAICTDRNYNPSLLSTIGSTLSSNRVVFKAKNEEQRNQDSEFTLLNPDLFQFRSGHIAALPKGSKKRSAAEATEDAAGDAMNKVRRESEDPFSRPSSLDPTQSDRKEPRERKESWKKQAASNKNVKPSGLKTEVTAPDHMRFRPPPWIPSDFGAVPKLPIFQPIETMNTTDKFYVLDENPFNRRGFRYYPCEAAQSMPAIMYRRIELPPYEPRIDWTDSSAHAYVSADGRSVTSNSGFRLARSNVCLRGGSYYFEIKVTRGGGDGGGHVRLGIARREASLEAPVGFDAYSYGIRDIGGQAMHMSRPRDFMSQNINTGDVIGFHVCLPPVEATKGRADMDVVRDRIPIRYRGQLYFEMLEYVPTKAMEDLASPAQTPNRPKPDRPPPLPGSFIEVYKNGQSMGKMFEGLFPFLPPYSKIAKQGSSSADANVDDGSLGYFPAISVFKGGSAVFNHGPDFEYPPPPGVLKASDRYDEQIADDVVWDTVDEVVIGEQLETTEQSMESVNPAQSIPMSQAPEIKDIKSEQDDSFK